MFKESPIIRRKSRQIMVGNVPVGGDAPITVQSMTNTLTTDVAATVGQIKALEAVGADIVRVSVPTMDAAEAFREIKRQTNIPLVACGLTPAISAVKTEFARWLSARVITIFRLESVLMAAL